MRSWIDDDGPMKLPLPLLYNCTRLTFFVVNRLRDRVKVADDGIITIYTRHSKWKAFEIHFNKN